MQDELCGLSISFAGLNCGLGIWWHAKHTMLSCLDLVIVGAFLGAAFLVSRAAERHKPAQQCAEAANIHHMAVLLTWGQEPPPQP